MRSIPRIIFSRIIGFIIFLILLAIANLLIPSINNNVYSDIVNFFNLNLILLLILTFIGLVNEIFWSFYFPFNIIAPITGSILSIYIITFIHHVYDFLEVYFIQNIVLPWQEIQIIVFWIVLITGYIIILIRGGKPREDVYQAVKRLREERWERKKEILERKIEKLDRRLGKKKVEWEDVGNEFKIFFYNIGESLNNLFNKDKEKKSK